MPIVSWVRVPHPEKEAWMAFFHDGNISVGVATYVLDDDVLEINSFGRTNLPSWTPTQQQIRDVAIEEVKQQIHDYRVLMGYPL